MYYYYYYYFVLLHRYVDRNDTALGPPVDFNTHILCVTFPHIQTHERKNHTDWINLENLCSGIWNFTRDFTEFSQNLSFFVVWYGEFSL